jgi:DNA repair protein RadC
VGFDRSSHLGHRQRLRDRFIKTGFEGFAEYEVVELLLTLAIPRSDVKVPAKALVAKFGNVRGVLDAPVSDLETVPGLGSVTPIVLKIIKEAGNMYLRQVAEEGDVLTSDSLSRYWRSKIGSNKNEVFEVAYIDSNLRLLRDGVETQEEGTVDQAAVYPRRVMEAALKRSAAGVIVAHNHPNGNVQPTDQDKVLTRALVLAACTVGVKVYDHLIVSLDNVFSFKQEGLL